MNEIDLSTHRRYLHDEVADRLRALIRSGELEPRARVNELDLAERFGTSRKPMREAIRSWRALSLQLCWRHIEGCRARSRSRGRGGLPIGVRFGSEGPRRATGNQMRLNV